MRQMNRIGLQTRRGEGERTMGMSEKKPKRESKKNSESAIDVMVLPVNRRLPTDDEITVLLSMWSAKPDRVEEARLTVEAPELVSTLGKRMLEDRTCLALMIRHITEVVLRSVELGPAGCVCTVSSLMVTAIAGGVRLGMLMEKNDRAVEHILAGVEKATSEESSER
jgi:hypothetical protein